MADIYKAESDKVKRRSIGLDVSGRAEMIGYVAKNGKARLNDTEEIKRRTELFLSQCNEQGCIPTIMGLCVLLGVSRQRVYKFMSDHPEHPTAQYVGTLQEAFADILTQAALRRDVSDAMSIFILKNTAAMADKVEIAPVVGDGKNPLGEYVDEEELRERIAASIVVEDDD